MKKLIIIIWAIGLLFTWNSCSDDNFSDRYPDPSKTPTVSVEKLMTGIFERGNLYTMPWYWRYFTFEIPHMGKYTQVMGWINTDGMYEASDSYGDDRWTNFYKLVSNLRLMEETYNNLDKSIQGNYDVFLVISKIYIYDHLQQVIDVWGDAPYSEAGYIGVKQDIVETKPAYDKAEDLYKMMLNDLKEFNTYLADVPQSSFTNTLLKDQDYINSGDVDKWRTYCNSLLLRMAVRVADHGSLAEEGKSLVKEILANPEKYPLVDDNSENILINYQSPKLTALEGQHEDGIKGGFESSEGNYNRASKKMVEILTGDPRLPIIYDTNAEGEYIGIDPLMERTLQRDLFNREITEGGNYFSSVDSATFSRNKYFPGIIVTASEIDFIKAEAILKWGVNGQAKDAFVAGITKSIEFYYYLNHLSDYRDAIPAPSSEEMIAFANAKWDEYANKEEAVAVQKWLHLGLIQMVQAWNEVRRTGYPVLEFTEDMGAAEAATPPNRLKYTNNEKVYNADNYSKVQSTDNYYTKIFWMK